MRAKVCRLVAVIFLMIILPGSIESQDRANLLSEDDIALETSERNGTPALSGALGDLEYWESYNQWMCFNKDSVKLTRVEVRYDGKIKYMPQLDAWLPGHYFEISLSGDTEYDNDRLYSYWDELLERSEEICAYAAYLQQLDPRQERPSSLWVISRLKTERGYWIEADEHSRN